MKIEYHPAIKHELQEIVKYYNRCSQGLGTEMKRFPYAIYFRALKNDVLRVMK